MKNLLVVIGLVVSCGSAWANGACKVDLIQRNGTVVNSFYSELGSAMQACANAYAQCENQLRIYHSQGLHPYAQCFKTWAGCTVAMRQSNGLLVESFYGQGADEIQACADSENQCRMELNRFHAMRPPIHPYATCQEE